MRNSQLLSHLISLLQHGRKMMGDEVMTTAMLDRLLHHAHIFTLEGESYRLSNRKEVGAI